VGVLPKQIRPVEVSRMLESLRLVDPVGDDELEESAEDSTPMRAGNMQTGNNDTAYVAREMARQQRRFMREDSDLATARIIDSMRDMFTAHVGESRSGTWSSIALVAIVFATAWVAWSSHRDALRLADENARLRFQAPVAAARFSGSLSATDDADSRTGILPDPNLLTTLEWALNASASYPYGEIPLGDERTAMLEQLVVQLRGIGFSGVVRLESHVGRFCEVRTDIGGWALAPPGSSLAGCGGLADNTPAAIAASGRQSVAFANSLAVLSDPDGDIRVEVEPYGSGEPAIPYPYQAAEVMAGDWNEVAALNNRVDVRLLPDPR
jgi:hypothetical protein